MIVKLHNSKKVDIKFYNARNILLKCNNLIKVEKNNNVIHRLIFNDDFYIEIGDLFPILHKDNSKLLHHVSTIKFLKNNEYLITSEQINKTTHWLLPFVANNEKEVGYNTFLKNAYYFTDKEYFKYYEHSCLFLKYVYIKEEDLFFQKLDKLSNCKDVDTNYSNFEFVYILSIDEKWLSDVKYLIAGKYSKISDKAKNRILNFHNLKRTGITGCILFKDKNYMRKIQKDFDIVFELPELETKFTENINLETLE